MINRFQKFLSENHLHSESPVLIGTSGGRDSMVLCHLYLKSDIPFSIAHCNFSLRGKESDQDEGFVKEWAEKNKVKIHIKNFSTKEHAVKQGISIQMAARELRVNWFHNLCKEYNYEFYATAHHQDDAIETYFINQIRGTGLSGLHGILPKQGRLIHPLLFCNREEITQYAQQAQISWRDDSSNAETKYLRNKIRHQLVPLLQEINPHIKTILQDNMNRLRAAEEIYQLKMNEITNEIFQQNAKDKSMNLSKLNTYPQASLILFESIQKFGFNFSQCSQILQLKDEQSGAIFESESYLLLKNRETLLIQKKTNFSDKIWEIEKETSSIQQPIALSFYYRDTFKINSKENTGQFDFSKLKFPLLLRKWKNGDFFYPLGMRGRKKLLSDYFIDEKMSVFDKNNCWLLCSGKDIIWIIGRRADERYKITNQTKKILEIKWTT